MTLLTSAVSKVPTYISHMLLYTCTHVKVNAHNKTLDYSKKPERGARNRGKEKRER